MERRSFPARLPHGKNAQRPKLLAFRCMGRRNVKEAKQHHSEAWFQAIVGGTADAYIGVNLLGKVVVFNPAAEVLFGRPASALLGRAIEDCGLPDRLRRAIGDAVREVRDGGHAGKKKPGNRSLARRRASP